MAIYDRDKLKEFMTRPQSGQELRDGLLQGGIEVELAICEMIVDMQTQIRRLTVAEDLRVGDLSLRILQIGLPWNLNTYSAEFKNSVLVQRDFEHALIHIIKAAGKLAGVVDQLDHGERIDEPTRAVYVKNWIADIVISALRMANTSPLGRFVLQNEVVRRIDEKSDVPIAENYARVLADLETAAGEKRWWDERVKTTSWPSGSKGERRD